MTDSAHDRGDMPLRLFVARISEHGVVWTPVGVQVKPSGAARLRSNRCLNFNIYVSECSERIINSRSSALRLLLKFYLRDHIRR